MESCGIGFEIPTNIIRFYFMAAAGEHFSIYVGEMDCGYGATSLPSVANSELPVLPSLKPGVGRNIATRASPAARNFFLSNFILPGPFDFIFSKSSLHVCLGLALTDAGSRAGPRSKTHGPIYPM